MNNKKSSFFSFITLALLFLLLPFNVQAKPATLVFSAIPDQDQTALVKRFGKVADYLSKKLGVPVKYVPVKSYSSAITAFRNNQIQLAWFGGLSGVRARLLAPGSQAITQGREDTELPAQALCCAFSPGTQHAFENTP